MSDAPDRSSNRLADEKSPYLLQHAHNPVDWRPWGEEAFRVAREEDRPVFLSVGYSTCHWCHVMAHESFEDEEVAELINRVFVPVKVDREERPDVDSVYMSVCQAMTGRGGWPLTVLLTPDREPFFAATYLPRRSRGGQIGLMELVPRVAELWENERERLVASGRRVVGLLRRDSGGEAATPGAREEPAAERSPEARSAAEAGRASAGGASREAVAGDRTRPLVDESVLDRAFRQLEDRFDEHHGGFGSAPKFPSPHNLLFLLRHGDRTGDGRGRAMVERTLRRMRLGGVYDQVGYGFHRYSTDARWFVPHFEKMLYDQALLAMAYTETWQVTGDPFFARVTDEIFTYLERDLRAPEGGFCAAEDADSEGGEGTFYVWRQEQLRELLEPEDFRLAREVFGASERGNFAEEATGERTGANILHVRGDPADLAAERGWTERELWERLERICARLFEARQERPRPHRDEKVLTDWNGLAVAALARAGAVMDRDAWRERATAVAAFLLERMRDADGKLLHRYRDGDAGIAAMADDYAYLVWGLVELYEATLTPRWLAAALELHEELVDRCRDPAGGGFFLSGSDVRDLPFRPKDVHDGALPSANSVTLWNTRRLARLTGRPELEELADELEAAFADDVAGAPRAHTGFLLGVDFRVGSGHEVVVAGEPDTPGMAEVVAVVREGFRPRTVLLRRPVGEEAAELTELAPFTREQTPRDGRAMAYVCRDFACEAPTGDPAQVRRLLEG